MMRYRFLCLCASLLALCSCAKGKGISLFPYRDMGAGYKNFAVCHGFGCEFSTPVSLTPRQWKRITAPLRGKIKTPEKEREAISRSVALMEVEVQKAADLRVDRAQAKSFEKDQDQMDCLDETINTSHYIAFFANDGLFKFHEVADPVHRGYFLDGRWPHNSAAIIEKESGTIYAVDSYYSENGGTVHSVDLGIWLADWRPEGINQEANETKEVRPPLPKRKPAI